LPLIVMKKWNKIAKVIVNRKTKILPEALLIERY
jgi:hypothetical protein